MFASHLVDSLNDGSKTKNMRTLYDLDIHAQPDDVSCGPTCLHALYRYYGDTEISLAQVMKEIARLHHGGTLLEVLASHALKRGYQATIYTFHVQMYDPTWFAADGMAHTPSQIAERLQLQVKAKKADARLKLATKAAKEFIELGGVLKMEDLTTGLISRYLLDKKPILAGLSSTFLYRQPREYGPKNDEDDVLGIPQGHFVMVIGYDSSKREVVIADPLDPNPPFHTAKYRLPIDRFVNAVLLGILTHDANLLVITPKEEEKGSETKGRTKLPKKPKAQPKAQTTRRPKGQSKSTGK